MTPSETEGPPWPAGHDAGPSRPRMHCMPNVARPPALLPALAVLAAVALALGACRSTPLPEPQPYGEQVDEQADAFLVIGDSRHGFPLLEWGEEPSDAERLAFAAALRDESPAFVVHVGDIARKGSDAGDWRDFDVDFAPLREAGIALFPALGNHEYRGPDDRALDLYFARFPELGRRRHYVRTFRGVRLIFLDSNTADIGAERAERQLTWLRRRLAEADEDGAVRAVMLFAHHPVHSNRVRSGESDWMRDRVLPLAAEFPKTRALFTGHVHSYERFVVSGVHCVVTGGAGSPLQTLGDADADGARPDLYRGPRGFHYCRVRIGDRITVEVIMLGEDGRWFIADRFDV